MILVLGKKTQEGKDEFYFTFQQVMINKIFALLERQIMSRGSPSWGAVRFLAVHAAVK